MNIILAAASPLRSLQMQILVSAAFYDTCSGFFQDGPVECPVDDLQIKTGAGRWADRWARSAVRHVPRSVSYHSLPFVWPSVTFMAQFFCSFLVPPKLCPILTSADVSRLFEKDELGLLSFTRINSSGLCSALTMFWLKAQVRLFERYSSVEG